MIMDDYLNDVRYALHCLITLVWKERKELQLLITKKKEYFKKLEDNKRVIEFLSQNPDLDDEGIVNFSYWESKDIIPELNANEKIIIKLKEEIKNKQYSIDLLASSILQIVKQGISRVFSNLEFCSDGRAINTISLKEIIWHGRNQGLHFELGPNFHPATIKFFTKLKSQFPERFDEFQTKNMSFKILEILGWKTFNDIKLDMLSFMKHSKM